MTLYARGYRPYEGSRDALRLRFWPIARDGYKSAVRGWPFWVLYLLGLVFLVILAVMLYLGEGMFSSRIATLVEGGAAGEELAADTLVQAVKHLQLVTSGLAQILVLFAAAGLIADDMRSRALPLYLVRPITPIDYYLGKILIPIRVLGLTVLLPGLLLILIGALFRPSDRMLPFLWARRDLALAVLAHYAVVAVSFSSLALLASTWAGRRVAAIVLGGVIFFGGGIPRLVAHLTPGTLGDLLDAGSLYANARSVLEALLPESSLSALVGAARFGHGGPNADSFREYPALGPAMLVTGLVVLLAAWTVVRRARTVEVVA